MPRQPQIQTIHNFDDLKKVYPQYKNASMNQLLIDLTNTGYVIDPLFYRDLQDYLLATEQATQHPVAELAQLGGIFPAAAKGDITPPNVDAAGGGGGGSGGGGGGGRAAAMTPEQELDLYRQKAEIDAQIAAHQAEQQAAQAAERDRLQREFDAQQAELQRQAQLRLQRLGDLTQLVGQFAGFQSRARETLAGLQGDPFAFAAAKQGLAPSGVTPMQSFRGDLSSFAARPLPQVNANAPMPDIEAAIQGLQGQAAPPQQPGIFGFAGGGQVSGGPQRVLVGERGPEVVEGSDFRVTPLTGQAATGGFFPPPAWVPDKLMPPTIKPLPTPSWHSPLPIGLTDRHFLRLGESPTAQHYGLTGFGAAGYDTGTLLPALSPLYAGLGLGNEVPRAGADPSRGGGYHVGNINDIGKLGFSPRLIGDIGSGKMYYRDPSGTLHWISSSQDFNTAKFNYGDVLNVWGNELSRFGPMGAQFAGEGSYAPMASGGLQPFGPLSQPIIEPVTGAILPAPFRAVATLQHLKLTNPAFYQLALSAYANSTSRFGDPNAKLGYNQAAVEAEMAQALPTGAQHGLIGLR